MGKQNKDSISSFLKTIFWIVTVVVIWGVYAHYTNKNERKLIESVERITENKHEDETYSDFFSRYSEDRRNAHKAAEHNEKGIVKYFEEDYPAALKEFNKAIELAENQPMPYNNRGNTKAVTMDIKGAIHDYTKAIELDKSFGEAYFNRGTAYSMLGKFDKACVDIKEAQRLDYTLDDDFFSYDAILSVMECE